MRIVLDPPLPDAFIIFEDVATGRLHCAKTDPEGKASLYLPVGTYNLKVFKEGYKPYSTTVTVDRDLVIPVTLEEVEVGVTLEVSGADPKNPVWMPTEGWTYIFSFEKIENARAFALSDSEAAITSEDCLWMTLVEERNGYVRVLDGGQLNRGKSNVIIRKVAAALRIYSVNPEVAPNYPIAFYYWNCDGTKLFEAEIDTDGDYIYVYDCQGDAEASIPFTTDWLVAVFDYDNAKASIHKPDGTLLADLSLYSTSYNRVLHIVGFGDEGLVVDADWIAILTTIKSCFEL